MALWGEGKGVLLPFCPPLPPPRRLGLSTVLAQPPPLPLKNESPQPLQRLSPQCGLGW